MSVMNRFAKFIEETDRKVLLTALFMFSPLLIGVVGAVFVRADSVLQDFLAWAYVITNLVTIIIFLSIAFLVMAFEGESRRGRPSQSPIDVTVKVTLLGSSLQAASMAAARFGAAQGGFGLLHVLPGLVAAVTLTILIWVSTSKR